MTVLAIKTKGSPELRMKCSPVGFEKVGHMLRRAAYLDQVILDMLETAHAKGGIGLAANQVGYPFRVIVVSRQVFINPEILAGNGRSTIQEGCLSIPGKTIPVTRAKKVKVRYQDENGGYHTVKATNLIAHVFQHEIDHLDGVLVDDSQVQGFDRTRNSGWWHP